MLVAIMNYFKYEYIHVSKEEKYSVRLVHVDNLSMHCIQFQN